VGYDPQVAHIGRALVLDKAATTGIGAPEAPEVLSSDGSPVLDLDPTVVAPIGPSAGVSTS
jgi:hypothetical protein